MILSGRVDTTGRTSEAVHPVAVPAYQYTNITFSSSTAIAGSRIGTAGYILPSRINITMISNTNPIPPLG